MAYRLALDGDLQASVRRVARDQLEGAADGLAAAEGDARVAAVHDARKRIKKTRALLRAARPGLTREAFRAENRALRDAGRELSGARDADVMIETVDKLADRFAGHLPATVLDGLRGRLTERAGEATVLTGHADTLRALAAGADAWVLAGDERKVLARALRTSYERGRDAFALADREPTAEHLHEWRKRVKDLWYQERLVNAAWPGVLKAHAQESKALSQLLGDDHDLAVLDALLAAEPDLSADAADIRELIGRRRGELLEASRALGRRVYAERPKAFARRLRGYLSAPGAEAPLAG